MKFKRYNLDESLFDTEPITSVSNGIGYSDVDDDFSSVDYDVISKLDSNGVPSSGAPTGVSDSIIHLINDEWEAIRGYNDIIEMIRVTASDGEGDFQHMLPVLTDIVSEENKHVGQLQELLKTVSPNAAAIEEGEREGREQLNFVNGKLQVQEMPSNIGATTQTNEVSEFTTLTDVDDEW